MQLFVRSTGIIVDNSFIDSEHLTFVIRGPVGWTSNSYLHFSRAFLLNNITCSVHKSLDHLGTGFAFCDTRDDTHYFVSSTVADDDKFWSFIFDDNWVLVEKQDCAWTDAASDWD